MKYLRPSRVEDLDALSPIVWASTGAEPTFVFDVAPTQTGFICFFLRPRRGALMPRLAFNQGADFSTASALSLPAFPLGFYHVAIDRMDGLEEVSLRPCTEPATFQLLAFRTKNAALVAVLHYLFNLRYQSVTLTTSERRGRGGLVWLTSNVTRITKFFGDVRKGEAARIQESEAEILAKLELSLAPQVQSVRGRMQDLLGKRQTPLLSFVCPTFNTRETYLSDLLGSFADERASYAELILSDDGSKDPATLAHLSLAREQPGVAVVLNPQNAGIAAATNAGLRAARGDWVAFIDHDDLFASGAVAMIAQAIQDHPAADFFYTDEVIVDAKLRPLTTFCKPAFDSVLLTGMNYINHFSVFRRSRLLALGGLRTDREGSQDYDLLLRYLCDVKPGAAIHIPFLAYRWRREGHTYSTTHLDKAVANARLALHAAMTASGRRGEVVAARDPTLHRVQYEADGDLPLVSVVIPNKNRFDLISRIVADLRDRTSYPAIEVVIVDNGSDDDEVLAFYRAVGAAPGVVVDIVAEAFNFAAMCNRGARLARGQALLFLNNDIEVLDAGWLDEMVACLVFPAVGIVGAKLLYPSGLVQHNGVIVGLGDLAGHWYIEAAADDPGPMGRFAVRQTLSAVTGACMLVTRACFDAVGGFDADAFAIAYNDIDLCLRAKAAGFRTLWTPFAELRHYESATRGSDEEGANNVRFRIEGERLQRRHGTKGLVDDAYHPFLDRRHSKPRVTIVTDLPPLRPNIFP